MNGCRIQGDHFNGEKKKKSYPYAWMIGVKRCQLKKIHITNVTLNGERILLE